MSFTWPAALLLSLAVPLVLGAYLLSARRRRRHAITYSSLALLRKAVPRRSRWRRHVPVALMLTSLAVLAVAAARPQLTSDVPVAKTTIILALDESGSMCLTDVQPNRLTVAQHAAREFVDAQPKGTQMGLVVFAGYAELAVAPTNDRSALDHALENLSTSPGTAIGAAILKSLDAIAEVDPAVQPVGNAVSNAALAPSSSNVLPGGTGETTNGGSGLRPKAPKDGYVPDIIVLLTDGANNRGITPLQAVPNARRSSREALPPTAVSGLAGASGAAVTVAAVTVAEASASPAGARHWLRTCRRSGRFPNSLAAPATRPRTPPN
jgi:Ca-activated chloride channel family protein